MANNTNKTAAENEELEQLKALLAEKEKQAAEAEAKLAEKEQQAASAEAKLAEMEKQAAEAAEKEKATPKKVTVKIRIPRLKKEESDVFVSVNDYTCIVKRGVEVEVPDFVAEVLRHREEMLEFIMLSESAGK